MSTYIYSRWINSPANEPCEFYSELDSARYETRKIEIFRNGKVGFASGINNSTGTMLGIVPVPSILEIKLQCEFETKEIDKSTFEQKWQKFVLKK